MEGKEGEYYLKSLLQQEEVLRKFIFSYSLIISSYLIRIISNKIWTRESLPWGFLGFPFFLEVIHENLVSEWKRKFSCCWAGRWNPGLQWRVFLLCSEGVWTGRFSRWQNSAVAWCLMARLGGRRGLWASLHTSAEHRSRRELEQSSSATSSQVALVTSLTSLNSYL